MDSNNSSRIEPGDGSFLSSTLTEGNDSMSKKNPMESFGSNEISDQSPLTESKSQASSSGDSTEGPDATAQDSDEDVNEESLYQTSLQTPIRPNHASNGDDSTNRPNDDSTLKLEDTSLDPTRSLEVSSVVTESLLRESSRDELDNSMEEVQVAIHQSKLEADNSQSTNSDTVVDTADTSSAGQGASGVNSFVGGAGDGATVASDPPPMGQKSAAVRQNMSLPTEGQPLYQLSSGGQVTPQKPLPGGQLTPQQLSLFGQHPTQPLMSPLQQPPPPVSQVSTFPPHHAGYRPEREDNPQLPHTAQMLVSNVTGAKVYLVGTAHFSEESCDDVSQVIKAVQPDVVMIELCKQRANLLQLDEETILRESQNMSFEKARDIINSQGPTQGLLHLLLISMSAHITKELGMAPGGEFRRAYQESLKVPGCMVHLGDRPIGITLKRALSALSLWQKIKLTLNVLTTKDSLSKEEVERCKDRDLLEKLLADMAGEYPALSRVFVTERDQFLAHSLQMAADNMHSNVLQLVASRPAEIRPPPVVVGVVGIGHVSGITKHWGKVRMEDIREITRVDPPSRVAVVMKSAVKLAITGCFIYGTYRVTRASFRFVKSLL